MKDEKYINWFKKAPKNIDPPGCYTLYLPKPFIPHDSITLGIVFEHRFAFYYWSQFYSKRIQDNSTNQITPTDLITIDWHDDVGVPNDIQRDELSHLNIRDKFEIGFYCWSKLRVLNDGHIAPALYLNFFRNTHVLVRQNNNERTQSFNDINGNNHKIFYHFTVESLINSLQGLNVDKVFLDIDLDYFTVDTKNPIPENDIRSLMNTDSGIMKWILPRLVGMTIALEPDYCGEAKNCIKFLNIINEEFFSSSLCKCGTKWNL